MQRRPAKGFRLGRANRDGPRGGELTEWQAEHYREQRQVRARAEHIVARTKTSKILRDGRLKGTESTTPCSALPARTTVLRTG